MDKRITSGVQVLNCFNGVFIFATSLIFATASLYADNIYLRSGEVLEGRIVSQNYAAVVVRTDREIRTIPKANINRITYGPVASSSKRKVAVHVQVVVPKRTQKIKALNTSILQIREIERQKKIEEFKKQQKERISWLSENLDSALNKKPEPRQPFEQESTTADSALLRSSILPGWGQWSSGNRYKGAAFMATSLLAGYALYESNRIYRVKSNNLESFANPYSQSNLPFTLAGAFPEATIAQLQDPVFFFTYRRFFEGPRNRLKEQYSQVRLAGSILALIYTANLFDAYYLNGVNVDVAPDQTMQYQFSYSLLW